MGPLGDLMNMVPGLNTPQFKDVEIDEKQMDYVEAIILSMTPEERANPAILNVSRKQRIAKGSGRGIQEVNRLIKQFNQMQKMMKQFSGMAKGKKGRFNLPFM